MAPVPARHAASVRAADVMTQGRVIRGDDLANALDDLFADATVVEVHVHNAAPGCFAAKVTRPN